MRSSSISSRKKQLNPAENWWLRWHSVLMFFIFHEPLLYQLSYRNQVKTAPGVLLEHYHYARLSQSLWTTTPKNFYHFNQLSIIRCEFWFLIKCLGVAVQMRWLNLAFYMRDGYILVPCMVQGGIWGRLIIY